MNLRPTNRRTSYVLIVIAGLTSACASLRDSPKYQLDDDIYLYRQQGDKFQKTWVYVNEDTMSILSYSNPDVILKSTPNTDQYFLKKSFDVDVMTVAFKYRPATNTLPRQLTTDFNGNVFLGYRLDRFRIIHKQTPIGEKKIHKHRGVTAGLFGGLASTSITPSTTNNKITDEYNGFTLSRGAAVMIGVNSLTVGFGVGWDYLTDRDKTIWIYQNKPWYGLTVGLNLN